MSLPFNKHLLDILTYIGSHIDKNILITCASILIFKEILNKIDFKEINDDLFNSDKSSSLAHCVAKDLGMGKGIATLFKKKYGGVNELKSQKLEVGNVGILERDGRYIYYLITKLRSSGYPIIHDLKLSLIEMKKHAINHGVKMISMPRIGSGLDSLDWNQVKETIIEVFNNTEIKIRVYYL
jgi:O-acetyl-ADP-ribose deacetylase (regulator of RNase III)